MELYTQKLKFHLDQIKKTKLQLLQSERRLNKAQEMAHVGNWELELDSQTIWASAEAYRIYGLDIQKDILSLELVQKLVYRDDRRRLDAALKNLLESNINYDVEFRINKFDSGEELFIHSSAELELDDSGKPSRVLGVIQDITQRKQYEAKLMANNGKLSLLYGELLHSQDQLRKQLEEITVSRELLKISEEWYKTLMNSSEDIIYSCDTKGVFLTINSKFSDYIKLPMEKITGKKMSDFISDREKIAIWESNLSMVINSGKTMVFENRTSDGTIFSITLSPLTDINNMVVGIIGTNHDVTESRKTEKTIKKLAYHDELTSLPNRLFFSERLKSGIAECMETSKQFMLLFIDLDGFKKVNDTMGHLLGDNLLKDVSRRLKSCIRDFDIAARISGDEFTILLNDTENYEEVSSILNRISNVFNEPFYIDNNIINMTASIGVSVFPEDADSAEELLRCADIAMYKAKQDGKNRYQFFNVEMKNELIRKLNIENMLKKADCDKEFTLHYQPQYAADTKKLRGFEALIRWKNPEFGFLNPGEFIPIAEETGLITKIDEWVLKTACKFCKKINVLYGRDITVAVNISPLQLKQINFYSSVVQAVNKAGIKPSNLELEVTENIFIDNIDFALKVLEDLKSYGIKIALDDFGTGYSSLSYLKRLPINLLKIDKSFIDEISDSNSMNDFTGSIISLAHKLSIEALAEGVETKEQYDYLVKAGVDNVQGYYMDKPLREEEIVLRGINL